MNISGIIGISGIVYALRWVLTADHSHGFGGYMDMNAIVLLGIMPPSVMLLSHSMGDFFTGFSTLMRATFSQQQKHQRHVIDTLTRASGLIRAEGMGSLMKIRNQIKYELLQDGISLIINDFTPEEIRHNLQAKITSKQSKLGSACSMFENMSKMCPGIGMIGTLIGLIAMLSNMSDPDKLGSGMALAMITTLYGLSLGTLFYGPFGEKVGIEAEKILELDLMVLEGVLMLKGKKSSIHLKDIVKTYGSHGKGNQAPGGKPQRQGA